VVALVVLVLLVLFVLLLLLLSLTTIIFGACSYKALEPRHLVHLTERWASNRTNGMQTAFFNGMGYESWESIWCIWNGFTERDGEALRRISKIYREFGANLLTGMDTTFKPHVPVTHTYIYIYTYIRISCVDSPCDSPLSTQVTRKHGVYAAEHGSSNGERTLWTVVNRLEGAPALCLQCNVLLLPVPDVFFSWSIGHASGDTLELPCEVKRTHKDPCCELQ